MPKPSTANISSACVAGSAIAKPSDAPMKGAVQGEAIDHGQHAGQEIVGHRVPRLRAAQRGGRDPAELEHAGQVQADQREQRGQRRHDGRRLQLEAPAQLLAGRSQREHGAAERQEGQDDAGGVGQRGGPVAARVFGVPREAEHLDRRAPGTRRASGSAAAPPMKAPSSAASSVPEAAGTGAAALAASAASSAGDDLRRRRRRGPVAADRRFDAPGDRLAGLPVGIRQGQHHRHRRGARAALRGQRHAWRSTRSPCQDWVGAAAVWITSGVSGKNASVLPRTAAGRPSTSHFERIARDRDALPAPRGPPAGRRRAPSKSPWCSAVEPLQPAA